ncbi:MAG: murein biosynthesis integral membrane protein MurJ [Holosporaceae bacterium]|jgi:putative peptidoglycan lipid II flippase|nr:murein biosynthesis integral membrane protein MurJ [Holosporaceae bacterium]
MSLIKNVITVGGWTLAYRVSSFIRDIAQSYILGAGLFADIFSLAFKFSNSLRKLFAEGAFNASFLPIFSNSLRDGGHEESEKIASQIFTWLVLWLAFFLIICLIFFRKVMGVFAGGIDPSSEKFEHLVSVGRVCSPYVAASFLAALFGGILNTINKFAMTAASQLTLNFCVIAALFVGPLFFPSTAYTMAWATFFAGFVQAFILWIDVRHSGFAIRFDFSTKKNEVKLFFKKLLSGAVGAGVLQLNILVDFVLLSFLPTGAISYFFYVDHVHQFPIGILGIAFSTALLPPLTRAIHKKDFETAHKQMNLGLLFAFLFTLPAAVILTSLGEQIIGAIYGRGNFTAEHVRATYPALTAFAFGLPMYMATKVFSTTFFANKDTRTPFIGGIISIFVNVLMIAAFMPFMKHTGIAWATALASWSNWIYLAIKLKGNCKIFVDKSTLKECAKQLLISALMLASILIMNDYAKAHYLAGGSERNIALLAVSGTSILLFIISGKLLNAFSFMEDIKSLDNAKSSSSK